MRFSFTGAARAGQMILEAGLLCVLPLFFHRGFAEQFSYPKIYLTQVLILVGLAAWAIGLTWGKLSWPQHFHLAPPLALLAISILLSSVNSPVPSFSLRESAYFLCGPAWVLLLVSWGEGDVTVPRLARLAALAGTAVAAIALLQWAGYDPLLFGGYHVSWGKLVSRMHLYATFGNPNYVAGYLIGTIFLTLALGAAAKRLWLRASWWAGALAMLGAILGAGSRGAWGGLVVGALVAAFIWKPWRRRELIVSAEPVKNERQSATVNGFVTPALVLLATLVAGNFIEILLGRLKGRIYLWRFSWPMFPEHPLIGSGWGTYQLRYLDLQANFLVGHPEWIIYWTNNRVLSNDPLQLLLEAGLLGLAAFAWLLWAYGRDVREALTATASPSTRLWLGASTGGVTAMLVDSLFNFQFTIPPTLVLIFTLLAFPGLMGNWRPEETATDHGGVLMNGGPRYRWRAIRLLGTLGVLFLAGALLIERTRFAEAELDYRAGTLLEGRGEMALAEETYRHGIQRNPLNGRLHFGLARVLYLMERYSEGLAEIPLAERTYADSHLELLKGRIQDRLGLNAAALMTYRHALALDPTLKTVQADIARLSQTAPR